MNKDKKWTPIEFEDIFKTRWLVDEYGTISYWSRISHVWVVIGTKMHEISENDSFLKSYQNALALLVPKHPVDVF